MAILLGGKRTVERPKGFATTVAAAAPQKRRRFKPGLFFISFISTSSAADDRELSEFFLNSVQKASHLIDVIASITRTYALGEVEEINPATSVATVKSWPRAHQRTGKCLGAKAA
jgi:hypothetical protein